MLNKKETQVLKACAVAAIDQTNGEFCYTDDVTVFGMSEKSIAGYLSQLTQKNVITIAETDSKAKQLMFLVEAKQYLGEYADCVSYEDAYSEVISAAEELFEGTDAIDEMAVALAADDAQPVSVEDVRDSLTTSSPYTDLAEAKIEIAALNAEVAALKAELAALKTSNKVQRVFNLKTYNIAAGTFSESKSGKVSQLMYLQQAIQAIALERTTATRDEIIDKAIALGMSKSSMTNSVLFAWFRPELIAGGWIV